MVENDKIKDLISAGTEITGSAVGGAISFFTAGPIGAAGAAAAGTVLSKVLGKIGTDIYDRVLGHREKVRIGAATTYAINKINEKIERGFNLRQDDFFEDRNNNRSPAEEILEGVYLKSKVTYEERKVKHCGYFFANIAFDETVSTEDANYLLSIFEKLTYRQLCLLHIFADASKYPLRQNELTGQRIGSSMWTILQEINEQINLNLARQLTIDGKETDLFWGLGAICPSRIVLTRLGLSFSTCFSLGEIAEEDLIEVVNLLK